MNTIRFDSTLNLASSLDEKDALKDFRKKFFIPKNEDGTDSIYLCGNSLGLQPVSTEEYIKEVLGDWKNLGVEGHIHAGKPWLPYHELLTNAMSQIVGANPNEVVVMNSLTVNLHLMMVSFYRPETNRFKILIEHDAFPSDRYAVASQIVFHGYDPKEGIVELYPRPGESCLRDEDILEKIEKEGDSIALVLIGNTNYYTGQYFNMKEIAETAHKKGCLVGFDCAHGAGNVSLDLHESGCDFAVWCSYKYLNSGPGSLAGCFVHDRHAEDKLLKKFTGWWGHNKQTRFGMRDDFDPIQGVESWQLSNPPILSMAAVLASLHLFEEAGMKRLREKAILLTGYLEYLINKIENPKISIITPSDPSKRGCQLSIQVRDSDKTLYNSITSKGVIADWREPDVIRVAPVPLYNSFSDVYRFAEILKSELNG